MRKATLYLPTYLLTTYLLPEGSSISQLRGLVEVLLICKYEPCKILLVYLNLLVGKHTLGFIYTKYHVHKRHLSFIT